MRSFQLELIYESSKGETYAMQIGSGLFVGVVVAVLVVIAVGAAFLASAVFTYRGMKKSGKEVQRKEALCFQQVQECYEPPSVISTAARPGMPGETTILGGEWIPPAGTLWRKKTREKIKIRKVIFSIGKDCQEADYSIRNNPLISKIHAVLRYQYGSYYIADKNSVNGTFVNERRLALGQEVCLRSGDRIRIADEEFEFYM